MRRRIGCGALALLASGCVMETSTTRVRFRDPGEVTLTVAPAGLPAITLPRGRAPLEIPIAAGLFATGPGGASDYALQARRQEGGAIELHVETRLALIDGEHQTVLPGTGELVFPYTPLEALSPAAPTSASYRYSGCFSLSRGRGGYAIGTRAPCRGQLGVPYALDTPWDNVVEVREHRVPERGMGTLAILLPTLTFVLPGAILLIASEATPGGSAPASILGRVFVGVGIGLDLLALPTLFASESDRSVKIPQTR